MSERAVELVDSGSLSSVYRVDLKTAISWIYDIWYKAHHDFIRNCWAKTKIVDRSNLRTAHVIRWFCAQIIIFRIESRPSITASFKFLPYLRFLPPCHSDPPAMCHPALVWCRTPSRIFFEVLLRADVMQYTGLHCVPIDLGSLTE